LWDISAGLNGKARGKRNATYFIGLKEKMPKTKQS